ncbi:hypothetical protein AAKU55_002921 [Oxalobacteraceae bacterium GrIS 1.11]
MLKKILCAGLLASCTLAAHATTQSWSFTYTGFYQGETDTFNPSLKLTGQFSGDDVNHDGIIERGELSSFKVGYTDFVACGTTSNQYYSCSNDSFSFKSGGALNFSVKEGGSDPEGWIGGSHTITTGNSDSLLSYNPNGRWTKTLIWTPQTTLTVEAMPVPEPASYAMLVLGLLGIAGLQKRRQRG